MVSLLTDSICVLKAIRSVSLETSVHVLSINTKVFLQSKHDPLSHLRQFAVQD